MAADHSPKLNLAALPAYYAAAEAVCKRLEILRSVHQNMIDTGEEIREFHRDEFFDANDLEALRQYEAARLELAGAPPKTTKGKAAKAESPSQALMTAIFRKPVQTSLLDAIEAQS